MLKKVVKIIFLCFACVIDCAQENEGKLIKSALDRARASARDIIGKDFQEIKTDLIAQVVAINKEGFVQAAGRVQDEYQKELGQDALQRPDFAEFQFKLITKAVGYLLVEKYQYLESDIEIQDKSK